MLNITMKLYLLVISLYGLFICGINGHVFTENETESLHHRYEEHQHDIVISEYLIGKRNIYSYLYPEGMTLAEKLQLEETEWHWYPWKRIPITYDEEGEPKEDCEDTPSFYDFPDDLFTQEQRLQGAIVLHFIGALYFFTVTAVIVNDYFIPSVQCICDDLGLSQDVAAGTFMATATTMPEFFSNLISTFVAESDMGVGNIIGSLMFNMLMIAATVGFFDKNGGRMDWWQATRDCFLLSMNIILLTIFGWDGQVKWWEAMILVIFMIIYYTTMFQNERIKRFVVHYLDERWNCCHRYNADREALRKATTPAITEDPKLETVSTKVEEKEEKMKDELETAANPVVKKERKSLWRIPKGSKIMKFYWFYTWPIKLVLTCVIPSPKTYRFLYPLTFVMSIIVIGLNSYMTIWMLTTIGYTFGVPESIMGLTLLAYGGCLPEFFAALICSLNGQGAVNFSNSLGTNSLSILFSLGIPWFLRGVVNRGRDLPPYVNIGSYGMEYIILSLLLIIVILYSTLYISNYRFYPRVSYPLIFFYLVFLGLAIVIEMDILFPNALC